MSDNTTFSPPSRRLPSRFGSAEIQAGTELLQRRLRLVQNVRGVTVQRARPCGDAAVCSRLRATKWRHSSDLTAIPEISSSSSRVSRALVHSFTHSLTPSFLPSSPFFHRQPVNLHHVFLNRGGGRGGRVEACELDTTVNLRFQSPSCSPFSSPVLTHSFFFAGVLFFFIGMSHVGQAGNCSEPSRGAARRHREPDNHLRRGRATGRVQK